MPTLTGRLPRFAQGDNISVIRFITSLPSGETLLKAWLTVKVNITDADPGIFQKVITSGAVAGQGQITDIGGSGIAVCRFDLQQADTILLFPTTLYYYDVKAKTISGLIGTVESGNLDVVPRITVAVS